MSLRKQTPCDFADWDGKYRCPYADEGGDGYVNCEYWCGADEPQDDPKYWESLDENGFVREEYE